MSDLTPPVDEPEPEPEPEPTPEPEVVTGLAPQEAQPPGAEVRALDPTVANPGISVHRPDTPGGEPATVAVVHDSGASFFHSVFTLPRRFFDAAGNVVFGRHLNVTADEASGTEGEVGPPPAESAPAPEPEPVVDTAPPADEAPTS